MDLQTLKYFQTIARCENMTKASELLHISQPALSKSIQRLEDELGYRLFDREGKRIVLNEYGLIFMNHVSGCFHSLEEGYREMAQHKNTKDYTITFLVNSALTTLPSLITSFSNQYPNVKLRIWQTAGMPSGAPYDFSLDVSQKSINDDNHITVIEEEIALAVPAGHPLSQKSMVTPKDLEQEAFIALPENSSYRKLMDAYCLQNGIIHNVRCECFNYRNTRELLKAGAGISFFPEYTWGDYADPGMALIPLKPSCKRYMILSWPEGKVFSQTALLFREHLLKFFREDNEKLKERRQ